MNLSRRGLLGMFAASAGAAIITSGVLMPVKPALVRATVPELEPFPDYMAYLRDRAAALAARRGILYDAAGRPTLAPPPDVALGTTVHVGSRTYEVTQMRTASSLGWVAHERVPLIDYAGLPGRRPA